MKLKLQSSIICLFFLATIAFSQTRYLDEVFCDVETMNDVVYGNNVSILPVLQGGTPAAEDLEMDIYMPAGDTATDRPVVIILHTGSFLPAIANGQATGDKTDNATMEQCKRFAQKGYVAVAINYRLGWNPISEDENVRRSTLIQAAYRGLQDLRTAVRFFRKSIAEEGNPYGITDKFAVGGLGTGGYLSLAAGTLWDYESELLLPKFMDTSQDINGDGVLDAVPYIIPEYFGNLEGTTTGIIPGTDLDGDGIADTPDVPMCIPNHVGYSSEIHMTFNVGGALPDISWLDQGEVPVASMQCWNELYAPYGTGAVIVPTTGDFVIEAMGSLTVQEMSDLYGNNDIFDGMSIEITDPWYDFGSGSQNSATAGHDVYPGLFPIVTPEPSSELTPCGPFEVQGSPWDWWDNELYGPIADAYQGTPAGTMGCLALLDSPDMSEEKGMAYADMMQEFFAPRVFVALGLEEEAMELNTVFNEATTNQNVNQYVAMGLTLSASDLVALNECSGGFTMFAPSSEIDDNALAAIIENADTPLIDILAHHVYAGESLNAADLTDGMELVMMDGNSATISIGDNVTIDNATVVMADIVCSNGVIHIIDDLLFAEESSLEDDKNIEFSVYPNPSNGEININSLNNGNYNIMITNYLGDIILSKSLTGNFSFDLSNYSKGIYMIEVSNDNISETHKVVIK
tara:strand:- start:50 stop:2107 length:2058 start_codon:yes stop_codon:yes gene_type:complete